MYVLNVLACPFLRAYHAVMNGCRSFAARLGFHLSLGALLLLANSAPLTAATDTYPRAAAATVHPLATRAAVDAMRQGGNAIDGAVAAGLTLGVVDGHNSGVGGGCFMLVHLADGRVIALDGRETAPAAATRDMFVRDGQADPTLSRLGALAIGIPGSLKVYDHVLRHFGKLRLRDHLRNAARLARDGFRLDATYARRLAASADDLAKFDESKRIFLNEHGAPWRKGELLRQPDLARSYEAMAEQGIDWFYHGPFAGRAARWMRENGGIIVEEDFHRYGMKQREPVRTTYRGVEILGFGPPSSGGVHVAEILNILESFDLKSMGPASADFVHVVTEAMKLAFADRAHWLGDPDYARVPRGLISKEYARALAARIDVERARPVAGPGRPEDADESVFGGHTTHFSIADREGNWVACTATVNLSFGSKVVIPGTGIVMNNQMDDFSMQPGVPNAFGLIGAEANAVQPGKRPLSSMSPTLVLRDGRPVLALGAAGGPTIISQVVLAILRVVDFDMSLDDALRAPRFHHQWQPDQLRLEKDWPETVRGQLASKGHRMEVVEEMGAAQGVGWNERGDGFQARADPRGEGESGGY